MGKHIKEELFSGERYITILYQHSKRDPHQNIIYNKEKLFGFSQNPFKNGEERNKIPLPYIGRRPAAYSNI